MVQGTGRFPSPYGEVGFDQRAMKTTFRLFLPSFPSPYGEVGFDP